MPPSIGDEANWLVPADDDDIKAVAKHLITACEREPTPERSAVLASLLRTRDFTRAEWLLAMREVPFMNNYGQGFRLDLVQQVVDENRADRIKLIHGLPERDVPAFAAKHGLDTADFGRFMVDAKTSQFMCKYIEPPLALTE